MQPEYKAARARLSKKAGALLAQLRRSASLTQEEMARRLHMSHSQVARLERGARNADLADLLLWSEVCGVPFGGALRALDETPETIDAARAPLVDAIRALGDEDAAMVLAFVQRLQVRPG